MTKLSAIIPSSDGSRGGNVDRLVADLRAQSLPPDEIEVVSGVSPNGRARNVGVAHTTGDVLAFLDDDVRLGTPDVLRVFVDCLFRDVGLGMVGTSQLLPPDSSTFQRRCACQIARTQSSVVDTLTESDMVTTACCAMRRAVLDEVGGYHDRIIRGVDPELRQRVRRAGYRIAVAPSVWHYHPMPATLRELLRMAWRNGAASAYARRHFPQTVIYNPDGHVGAVAPRPSFPRRVLRNAGQLAADTVTGRWYGMLYGMAYAAGHLLERR